MRSRLWLVPVVLVFLSASTGCKYLQYRAEDFAEMLDIGITLSEKPCLSIYGTGVSMVSYGFSDFEGTCIGMGGGQVGIIRHQNECYGKMMWGEEDMVWGSGGSRRHYHQVQGLYAVGSSRKLPNPAYFPACVHYLHLIVIGVVANQRYTEMVDFILGFAFLDIACDDGRKIGKWWFQ